ncbi:MAG: hypothetical protein QOE90_431 [Thermoplasmata archaeon]|jgi:hypothetical protein|nr:hypothetical protein [Thermoplasmata archaeon]
MAVVVAAPVLFGFWVGLKTSERTIPADALIPEGQFGAGVAVLRTATDTYVATFVYARLPDVVVDSIVRDYGDLANQTVGPVPSVPSGPPQVPPNAPCLQNCPPGQAPPPTGVTALTGDLRKALNSTRLSAHGAFAEVSDFHFVDRSREVTYVVLGRLPNASVPDIRLDSLGLGEVAENLLQACREATARADLADVECPANPTTLRLDATLDPSLVDRFGALPSGTSSVFGPLVWDTHQPLAPLPSGFWGKLGKFASGDPVPLYLPTSIALLALGMILPALAWNTVAGIAFRTAPILPMPVLGCATVVGSLVAVRYDLVPWLGVGLLVLAPAALYAWAAFVYATKELPWADYHSGPYVALGLVLVAAFVAVRLGQVPWNVTIIAFLASGQASANAALLVRQAGFVFIGTLVLGLLLAFGPIAGGALVGSGHLWSDRRRRLKAMERPKDFAKLSRRERRKLEAEHLAKASAEALWRDTGAEELGAAARTFIAWRLYERSEKDKKFLERYKQAVANLRGETYAPEPSLQEPLHSVRVQVADQGGPEAR